MYYEVYIDSLLLMHFVLNYYLLALTNLFLYQVASHKRLVVGALLGTFGSVGPMVLPIPVGVGLSVGFVLSVWMMCKYTFRVADRKQFLQVMEKMILMTLVLGGTLWLLLKWLIKWKNGFRGVLGILLLATSVYWMIGRRLAKKKEKVSDCKVVLHNGKEKIEMSALLDTGNSLVEPISGRPVSVAETKALEKIFAGEWPEGYRMVPFCSVGKKHGLLKAYLVKSILVEVEGCYKECQNVYIGENQEFFKEGSRYQMILNPDMLKGGEK